MIQALFILVVVGVAFYLIEKFVPMSEPFKVVFRIVVVLALIFWFLSLFGLVHTPNSLRVK